MIRPEVLKKNQKLTWSTGSGTDVWDLFWASITGDLNQARSLIEKDPTLVRSSHEYRSPLWFAVRENQLKIASFLLSKGADPTYRIGGDSLLTICTYRGYEEMRKIIEEAIGGKAANLAEGETVSRLIRERDLQAVKKLLEQSPERAVQSDEQGNRPIHWAVMTRQPELIDVLLEFGADINAKRLDGARPVQLVNGDYHFRGWTKEFPIRPSEILAHLRRRGANIDLNTACYTGDLDRVKEILNLDPTLANRVSEYITYYLGSGSPLRNAAANGHMEIIRLLLDYGADPNLPEEGIAPKGHALHAAVCNGHFDVVKFLLEQGAFPNVEIESSADTLTAAIARNNQPMIELLCSYGASRALHLLAYYGDIQTAAALFAMDPKCANNPEALENAASQGNESFVRLMLRYQPNLAKQIAVGVNHQGPEGPIRSRALTELLFQNGMDPNLSNWLHVTPLHRFASRGDLENAKLFIDHGADLNARDEEICSTPLGWAAKSGKLAMVELLLESGADLKAADQPSWARPLAWASRRKDQELMDLLKQNGAV
jgi:ankyrin repeat protein